MAERRCETCRFWNGFEHQQNEIGECRRYAPRPLDAQRHSSWHHPQFAHMLAGGWCGEHMPKIRGGE